MKRQNIKTHNSTLAYRHAFLNMFMHSQTFARILKHALQGNRDQSSNLAALIVSFLLKTLMIMQSNVP